MRTSVRITRVGDAYLPHFTPPQAMAIVEGISLVRNLQLPEQAVFLQVAHSPAQLDELLRKIKVDASELSLLEMHAILAVLAAMPLAFPDSEEAFHTRTGFFRENMVELAKGLITAIAALHQST